jgi:hypothetical protein
MNGVRLTILEQERTIALGAYFIKASAPLPASLLDYLPLLSEELAAYPVGTFEKCGLREIVICRGLTLDGRPRAAIPDFAGSKLYLESIQDGWLRDYARKTVHHEFFHMIDQNDDGILYSDEEWVGLNPPDFRYGKGGVSVQDDPTVSLPNESVPGFLNAYSRSGVEEDKAEVFSLLMTEPLTLEARSARDVVLAAKQRQMKALLRRINVGMDEGYWEAALAPKQ